MSIEELRKGHYESFGTFVRTGVKIKGFAGLEPKDLFGFFQIINQNKFNTT